MSKSIWDVRFAPRKMALDAVVVDALTALDEWKTIKGAKVEIGEGGEILHGMGGKFKNLRDIPRNTVKQRKGESMEELRDRAKKELDKGLAKPIYVLDMAYSNKTHQRLPHIQPPDSLDGAEDYFHQMRAGCAKLLKGLDPDSTINYKEKANELRGMIRSYEELGRLAYWRNQEGRGHEYEWIKDYPTKEKNESAANRMDGYVRAAKRDPTGVGYWQAQDVYKELKPAMSNKDISKYGKVFYDLGG